MVVSVACRPTDPAVDEAPFGVGSLEEARIEALREGQAFLDRHPFAYEVEVSVLNHSAAADPDCYKGICRAPVALQITCSSVTAYIEGEEDYGRSFPDLDSAIDWVLKEAGYSQKPCVAIVRDKDGILFREVFE